MLLLAIPFKDCVDECMTASRHSIAILEDQTSSAPCPSLGKTYDLQFHCLFIPQRTRLGNHAYTNTGLDQPANGFEPENLNSWFKDFAGL